MRDEDPYHYVTSLNSWWVSRHADVTRLMTDPRVGREDPKGVRKPPQISTGTKSGRPIPPSLIYLDPPDHTRLRSLLNRSFSQNVVEELRPRIARIAGDLLDSVQPGGRIDIVRDFTFPLPIIVISELFGIPRSERSRVTRWSETIIRSIDETQPPDVMKAAAAARVEFADYMEELVADPGTWEGGSVMRELVAAEERGDRLSAGELLATCALLLVAGHANTTHALSGSILALKEHPDQLSLLTAHPEFMPSAVEELLRFASPVHRAQRFAREDFEVHGRAVKRGDSLMALFSSANRDERVFSEPDRLDITRSVNPHFSLGRGAHFCLGAPLARAELAIGVGIFFERFPEIELLGPRTWIPGTAIRGLASLPASV